MNMIFKHIKEDFSRIKGNSIVLVVLLGICLVPCLYAWFNIAASWDPYKHTEELPMAVVNEDEGYHPTLIPKTFNIGEKVKMNLAVEAKVDWIFTDREDAVDGVKSGKYYAAVVIPKDFSEKMFSFLSPDGQAPAIEYYVNEKKNAIAPKVVGKEAGSLADWVKETFTRTLYTTAFDSLLTFTEDGQEPHTDALWQRLQGQLTESGDTLRTQASSLRSFQQLAESSRAVMKNSDRLMDASLHTVDEGMARMKEDKKDLDELKTTLKAFGKAWKRPWIKTSPIWKKSEAMWTISLPTAKRIAIASSHPGRRPSPLWSKTLPIRGPWRKSSSALIAICPSL